MSKMPDEMKKVIEPIIEELEQQNDAKNILFLSILKECRKKKIDPLLDYQISYLRNNHQEELKKVYEATGFEKCNIFWNIYSSITDYTFTRCRDLVMSFETEDGANEHLEFAIVDVIMSSTKKLIV